MQGRDKLLEPLDDRPLIAVMVDRALRTGCAVIVAVPDAAHPRARALSDHRVTLATVPDADLGMGHSLASGARALAAGTGAVMILPGDMPDLETEDLVRLIDARASGDPDALYRGTSAEGVPGHPVIFPRWCFAELRALTGDHGAKSVLQRHAEQVVHVVLPNRHALTDLDTQADWSAWRVRRTLIAPGGGET